VIIDTPLGAQEEAGVWSAETRGIASVIHIPPSLALISNTYVKNLAFLLESTGDGTDPEGHGNHRV
jgi:hypothetical protein